MLEYTIQPVLRPVERFHPQRIQVMQQTAFVAGCGMMRSNSR